jgi:hypothetical protein
LRLFNINLAGGGQVTRQLRTFLDFSGGLTTNIGDGMRDNELAVARDCEPGDGMGFKLPDGVAAWSRLPELGRQDVLALMNATTWSDQGHTAWADYVFAFTLDRAYYHAAGAESFLPLQAQVGIGGEITDWFVYDNYLYWLNGQQMKKTCPGDVVDGDGGITDAELVPEGETPTEAEQTLWDKVKKCQYVESYNQRYFYARSDSSEVIFSAVAAPFSFDSGLPIITVGSKDGEGITGLKEFQNGLLVFKPSSVYYVTGNDYLGGSDISIVPVAVTSGCQHNTSIATVENGVVYVGYNGLYLLRQNYLYSNMASKKLSDGKLPDSLFNNIARAFGCVFDNVYRFTLEGAQGRQEYRYRLNDGSFYGPYSQAITCYAPDLVYAGTRQGSESRLFIGSGGGWLLYFDPASYTYLDPATGNALPMQTLVTTKPFDLAGANVMDVRLKEFIVSGKQDAIIPSSVDVFLKLDYWDEKWRLRMDESGIWQPDATKPMDWGKRPDEYVWEWADMVKKLVPVNKKGCKAQFSFSNPEGPLVIGGVGVVFSSGKVIGSRRGLQETKVNYSGRVGSG